MNMLWKITPEGAAEAVWWDVKEARKKLKKGSCVEGSRGEGKSHHSAAHYTRHLGLVQIIEGRRQTARGAPVTPARGGGAMNRPLGRGAQVYNDTDTKAGF